jgi:hypothetical protein
MSCPDGSLYSPRETMERLRSSEIRHRVYGRAEREAIRRQLDRMLANPLFKNSKRYPNFLRYVVEHTLEESPGELKERTLGVEVFGREPNYDTNADPVVRATAGEIRKRIAQYYHEQGHESEIRIDLLPGSYVPEFEIPAAQPQHVTVEPEALEQHSKLNRWHWLVIATIPLILAALVAGKLWTSKTALDRFWAPVLDSQSTVLLCVGQRQFLGSSPEPQQQASADIPRLAQGKDGPITLFQLYYMGSQNVAFHDVKTLGRLTGLLQASGKPHHILGERSTSFADLRAGPVILVGAFNNDWTMRLTGPMRFSFERDGDTFWIKDLKNPAKRDRAVNYTLPYMKLTQDYALISRVLEPTTERMVVVAGGLTGFGTMAAGEFLTNRAYMEAVAKQGPKDWGRKNVQLVIATDVINGNSGPPRVVDQYFW